MPDTQPHKGIQLACGSCGHETGLNPINGDRCFPIEGTIAICNECGEVYALHGGGWAPATDAEKTILPDSVAAVARTQNSLWKFFKALNRVKLSRQGENKQ